MKYSHILWDWNGTLLDDVAISIDCVNILLDRLGLEKTNLKEYHQMMDIPIKKYYENLFTARKAVFAYESCTKNFQENYPKLISNARLAKNALEILEFFRLKGAKQYIVSSFEKNRLLQYVEQFGVKDFFTQISGDDDIHVGSKSQRAIDLTKGVERSKILYIGDTKADFITACDLNCDCVLTSKGHQPESVLKQFDCPVINDLIKLKNYI